MANNFPQDINSARDFKTIDRSQVKGTDLLSSQAALGSFQGANVDSYIVSGDAGAVKKVTGEPTVVYTGGYQQMPAHTKVTVVSGGINTATMSVAGGVQGTALTEEGATLNPGNYVSGSVILSGDATQNNIII